MVRVDGEDVMHICYMPIAQILWAGEKELDCVTLVEKV